MVLQDIIQDMKNALWVAVYAGFPKVVELLVGYGANLNATNEDGVTALHMLLAEGPELCMRPISDDMSQLKKVELEEAYHRVRIKYPPPHEYSCTGLITNPVRAHPLQKFHAATLIS